MDNPSLDKKGVLKAMFFAIFIVLLGLGILGWQYRQIEKRKLPALEEKIEKQKEETEERTAKDLLDKFMAARIGKNEAQAQLYLAEGAVEQKNQGELILVNDFESYEILNSEKLAENKFRFAVKIYEEGGMIDFVEVIILIKILDKYYIGLVEMAG